MVVLPVHRRTTFPPARALEHAEQLEPAVERLPGVMSDGDPTVDRAAAMVEVEFDVHWLGSGHESEVDTVAPGCHQGAPWK